MTEAATRLGVTHHRIRRLIKGGILPAEQVVPGAPYQIRADDLQQERVAAAIGRTGRPCRIVPANQLQCFRGTLHRLLVAERQPAPMPISASSTPTAPSRGRLPKPWG